MSTRINKRTAKAELAYRAMPKPRPSRKSLQVEGEIFHGISAVQQDLAFHAGGEALKAIVGTSNTATPAPAKAKSTRPAKKASKPAVDPNVKILRGLAWDMHLAAKQAGDKLTYLEACTALGVKRAKDERAAA